MLDVLVELVVPRVVALTTCPITSCSCVSTFSLRDETGEYQDRADSGDNPACDSQIDAVKTVGHCKCHE